MFVEEIYTRNRNGSNLLVDRTKAAKTIYFAQKVVAVRQAARAAAETNMFWKAPIVRLKRNSWNLERSDLNLSFKHPFGSSLGSTVLPSR